MAMPWFRVHSKIQDNSDIQLLPENMRWRFISLLCSRCKTSDLSDEVIAFQWRLPPSDVQETKALFIAKGFIDDNWKVLGWDKWQYASDSSSDRVRKFRANGKETTTKRFTKRDSGVPWNVPEADTDTEAERSAPIKRYFS
jgi:hypothetical protein